MAFGKRASEQLRTGSTTSLPRRAGWWVAWPLAILAAAVVSYLAMIVMALVPAFNPSGTPIGTIAVIAVVATLNVAVVAAIMMIFVDLLLRLVRYRRRWLYSVAVGGLAYAFAFWIGAVSGVRPGPLHYTGMVLIPAGVGGWVLGYFRKS